MLPTWTKGIAGEETTMEPKRIRPKTGQARTRRRPKAGQAPRSKRPKTGRGSSRKTGWHYNWFIGIMYGNIPVGILAAFVVIAFIAMFE